METCKRVNPNILITGTPGVGKSSISRLLSERTKFAWREVSKLAEEYNCLDEYDPEYQCPFLNEDKVNIYTKISATISSLCSCAALTHLDVKSHLNVCEPHGGTIIPEHLLDIMETMMTKGGNIVDYHGCEFFPERWFDGIFVVRANNTALYDRLTARGYTGKKLEDNIQCEIFETLLEEAQSSYKAEIVTELQNDTEDQLHSNVDKIIHWIGQWREENL